MGRPDGQGVSLALTIVRRDSIRRFIRICGSQATLIPEDLEGGSLCRRENKDSPEASRSDALQCHPHLLVESCKVRSILRAVIDQAMATKNTMIRGLAMLDRRLGRRRLVSLDPAAEIPLVGELLRFRLEVTAIAAGVCV